MLEDALTRNIPISNVLLLACFVSVIIPNDLIKESSKLRVVGGSQVLLLRTTRQILSCRRLLIANGTMSSLQNSHIASLGTSRDYVGYCSLAHFHNENEAWALIEQGDVAHIFLIETAMSSAW